jgi:hypothetical protein
MSTEARRQNAGGLWDRHDELSREADVVRTAAEVLLEPAGSATEAQVNEAYEFLAQRFLPAAQRERETREQLAERDDRSIPFDHRTRRIEELTQHLREMRATGGWIADRQRRNTVTGLPWELAALIDLHYSV